MKYFLLTILLSIVTKVVISVNESRKHYEADWDDLDKRPLPEWYDRAKVGIFIHWGVYSVPGFGSEWFWFYWEDLKRDKYVKFMKDNYKPHMSYADFAKEFRAEFFDPEGWADLIAKSGARYVVFTSKHHDGFTMFPSKQSFTWNSVDVGPRRDIVKELSSAVKKAGLKFGVYYSLYEWFNPLYLQDKEANFTTQLYPGTKVWPDLEQIIMDYEPTILWSDGDFETSDVYWNSTGFISWLYNDSPVRNDVVVNDRWGGTYCTHGDFYNCDDKFNSSTFRSHKWENALSLDKESWGFRNDVHLSDILPVKELIKEVVSTVSCGGNILINVGPTKEGSISPIFEERLLQLGDWLKINGEAIYSSSPWYHQNDTINPDVWFTCVKAGYNGVHPTSVPTEEDNVLAIYVIFLEWPDENVLQIGGITSYLAHGQYTVQMLGNYGQILQVYTDNGITNILLPRKSKVQGTVAWTLKIM